MTKTRQSVIKETHSPKENVCAARVCVCVCVQSCSALRQLLSPGMNEFCGWFFLCVFVREWTGRASGGDREEEQGDVGKWFSRWDLICETMHPKETFSHGPTPWIQIHPATRRSALEGRMHLASTRSGEVQPPLFLFFFSFLPRRLLPSNHETQLRWLHGSCYESSIHAFLSWGCLLLFSVMGPRIYNDGASVPEHVGRNIKWCQREAAGEFVKGGHVESNQCVLTSGVIWDRSNASCA